MKKAIAIVVFLSLLAQCLVQLGIIGYYELNKKYIAQNLCENRSKPELKCCGKCYLRKQLKKAASNESSKNTNSKTEQLQQVVFVLPVNTFLYFYHHVLAVQHPGGQHLHECREPLPFFHPPGMVC